MRLLLFHICNRSPRVRRRKNGPGWVKPAYFELYPCSSSWKGVLIASKSKHVYPRGRRGGGRDLRQVSRGTDHAAVSLPRYFMVILASSPPTTSLIPSRPRTRERAVGSAVFGESLLASKKTDNIIYLANSLKTIFLFFFYTTVFREYFIIYNIPDEIRSDNLVH